MLKQISPTLLKSLFNQLLLLIKQLIPDSVEVTLIAFNTFYTTNF
jgi:hypothetical protein